MRIRPSLFFIRLNILEVILTTNLLIKFSSIFVTDCLEFWLQFLLPPCYLHIWLAIIHFISTLFFIDAVATLSLSVPFWYGCTSLYFFSMRPDRRIRSCHLASVSLKSHRWTVQPIRMWHLSVNKDEGGM